MAERPLPLDIFSINDPVKLFRASKRLFEDERKNPESPFFQPELSDIAGQKALRRILASGGLTPSQRQALTAAAGRVLAGQADLAGRALGRRFAAQNIQNTGLANAGLAGILNNLLGAQQAQQSKLDELSIGILQNAISQLFAAEREEAARRFQEKMAGSPLGNILGTLLAVGLGKFTGGIGGALGQRLAGSLITPQG